MKFHQRAAVAGQQPLFLPDSRWVAPELPSFKSARPPRLAIDLESKDKDLQTLGPGWRRDAKIIGLALGTDDGNRWYLPTGHEGGGNLDEGIVQDWARDELNAYEGDIVGANLGYDLDGLANWGVTFPKVKVFHDVQVVEPLLDEWRFKYNLDALSLDYLGVGKDEALLNDGAAAFGFPKGEVKSNLWRLPANLVGPYAEGDVDRPLRILDLQLPRITAEDLDEIYTVERKLIPILVAMRRRGVRINEKKVEIARRHFIAEREKWLTIVRDFCGPTAELLEPASLANGLKERGINVPDTPKSGVPSVTRIFLERHQHDPLARAILNGRKFNTLINTFLDSQIMGHAVRGRVHPTFKQGKDDDGGSLARFAGSHPNLQFIPAREADWQEDQNIAPMVRGVFEPEEGEDWLRADASQIEYRFLTNFAVGKGAEEARERYRTDPKTDFHKLAATMLHVDPEDKIKRKRVKNTNFAAVYGAQVPKLADTFGCTIPEAEEFFAEYRANLPFVMDTFDAAAKWAKKRGYVVTILNRRMRFPFFGPVNYKRKIPSKLFRSREEAYEYYVRDKNLYRGKSVRAVERVDTYTALNKKDQGSSADHMKKSMVDIYEAGLFDVTGPFLVTVHDETGSSIPRTKAGREAVKETVYLMENSIKMKVPILVDHSLGADWGSCD